MYRNTHCLLQAHRGVCTEAPENTMAELAGFAAGHKTTVWVRQDNKRTAWCKVAPINRELADLVHSHGFQLGIWILGDDAEMADALKYGADVVETTGGVKP